MAERSRSRASVESGRRSSCACHGAGQSAAARCSRRKPSSDPTATPFTVSSCEHPRRVACRRVRPDVMIRVRVDSPRHAAGGDFGIDRWVAWTTHNDQDGRPLPRPIARGRRPWRAAASVASLSGPIAVSPVVRRRVGACRVGDEDQDQVAHEFGMSWRRLTARLNGSAGQDGRRPCSGASGRRGRSPSASSAASRVAELREESSAGAEVPPATAGRARFHDATAPKM